MSINEQIVRLQNAKNRLKEILVDKKVELSGNEKLDELIENVDNIETGAGTSDENLTPLQKSFKEITEIPPDLSEIITEKTYDTDEETILYTPNERLKYYYITRKNETEFRILWTNQRFVYSDSSSTQQLLYAIFDIIPSPTCQILLEQLLDNSKNALLYTEPTKLSVKEYFYNTTGFQAFDMCYCVCGSVEECIEAIKSDKTVYTYISEYANITTMIHENGTPIILSNGHGYANRKLDAYGRQISSNEKIEVIK